jgi:hypothetical protein
MMATSPTKFGWGGRGPEPIGTPGIVRFAADLRPEWRYSTSGEVDSIEDCYALNVAGETACGRPLPDNLHIIGRGIDLHVFTDATWYRLSLELARQAVRA